MKAIFFKNILSAFHEAIHSDIKDIIYHILKTTPFPLAEFRFKGDAQDDWFWGMEESSYVDIEINDTGLNTILAREKVVGISVEDITRTFIITETGTKENIEYLYGDDAVCLLAFLEEVQAALEDGDLVLCKDGILRDKEAAKDMAG